VAYLGKVPADVLIDPMVDSAAITDATIVTADLANDAVTSAKLAADSVDSSELIDGSVDNVHLAGSIATTKLTGALTSVGSHGLATSATTDTTNASNISSGTLAAARVATLNQNTTGTAATVTTAAQPNITSVGTLGSTSVSTSSAQTAFSVTSSQDASNKRGLAVIMGGSNAGMDFGIFVDAGSNVTSGSVIKGISRSASFTGDLLTLDCDSSASGAVLINAKDAGTSKFKVLSTGATTIAGDVTIDANNKFLKSRQNVNNGVINLIGVNTSSWVVLGESGYGLKSATGNTLDDGGGGATFAGKVQVGATASDSILRVRQDSTQTEPNYSATALTISGYSSAGQFGGGIGWTWNDGGAGKQPACWIGTECESYGGHTQASLIFATRNDTNNTVPTERLKITGDGKVEIGDVDTYPGGCFYKFFTVANNTDTTFFTTPGDGEWCGVVEVHALAQNDVNRCGYLLARFGYDETFTSMVTSSQNLTITLNMDGNNMRVNCNGGSSTCNVQIRVMGAQENA